MSEQSYVIDAWMSHQADKGIFCFCPFEDDTVITGLSVIGSVPPGKLVAIYHEDGQDAVEAWTEKHKEALAKLRPWFASEPMTTLVGSVPPDAEQLRLRANHNAAIAEAQYCGLARIARGAPLGMEDHMHGSGTYADPARSHSHPFNDPNHTHEPRSAEDAPWPDIE